MDRKHFPAYGWAGAGILAVGLGLVLLTEWWIVHTYFTPWMWTGYLLFADAVLARRRGYSWLVPQPGRFFLLLPISLCLWLLFEAYNLHLRNWSYVGLPQSAVLTCLGYVWSFMTIWPALFITADLLEAFGLRKRAVPVRITVRLRRGWFIIGLLMAAVPLILPVHLAAYLFVLVWIAFVPLIEPVLYGSRGVHSLLRDLEGGSWTRWVSLGAGGLICGLLWESWNMLSTAKWIYIFPLFQNLKLFEMPLPGYLGFIPFAWEAWSMYAVVLLLGRRCFPRLPGPPRSSGGA